MSEPAHLDADHESLSTLRGYWLFCFVRAQSEPLAAPFVQPLADFGQKWLTTATKEQTLRDAIVQAEAHAIAADRVCDGLLDQVSTAIHGGKKPDLSDPVHQLYFGSEAPAKAKRPTLGAQLEMMNKWPGLLNQATQPALKALAQAVAAGVVAGNNAKAVLDQAKADNAKFRLDGDRRQLFDTYNALMASTYGDLKSFMLAHPELNLPPDWADTFFRREPQDRGPTTIAQAAELVQAAQAQLAEAQALEAELEADAKAAEDAAKAEADAEAALAAAKAAADEADKKKKAAAAALKKAKKAKKAKGK